MDAHPQESQPRRTLWTVLVIVAVLVIAVVVFLVNRTQDSDDPVTEPTATSSETAPDSSVGTGSEVEILEQYAGLPEGEAGAEETGAVVMPDDGTIHVFTTGSSTCPAIPTAVTVDGDEIVVTVAADDAGPCTMDFVPTTSVIEIPDDYDGAEPPVVRVEHAGM
ncbi:hypothetical protein [Sanguibacter sp. 25GB23B1]|uniref:hypothetical protein n=1 Tax=unclassified Sanguibacter TaxID=2645534 RepID=UPI0032AF781D